MKVSKLRFNATLLDSCILLVMMWQVLIFRWISSNVQDIVNHIIVVLICISLIRYRNLTKKLSFTCFLIFIIYQLLNFIMLGGSIVYLFRNWYRTFKSVLIIFYLTNLLQYKSDLLCSILRKNIKLFNIYALINIPILLKQLTHDFSTTTLASLLGNESYRNSMYYSKDMMSGLFGLYGTPCLAMFIVFLIIYNYAYNHYCKVKSSKTFDLYNIGLTIFYMWMATQNDNKGFFIILALFVVVLYIAINEEKILNNNTIKILNKPLTQLNLMIKMVFIMVGVILLMWFSYIAFEPFKLVVDEAFFKISDGLLLSTYTDYRNVIGGGERFAMILFALSKPQSAFIGYGLGNYLYTSGNLGFVHFGQADIGTFICLGGSVYIMLMFLVVYQSFKGNYKSNLIPQIMTFIFFILASYTHIFHDTSITISIMLAYIVCWMAYNKFLNNKRGSN